MRVVIIHGQSHKGATYHVARELADKLGGDTTEFFLPRDFGEFCVGCTQCFLVGEDRCPHREKLQPITKALDDADVIILASPVYVYHATGAMKALLDHYGYRWMPHRPSEAMFGKQGVCICTAAGAGMKSTLKDMADSLSFWGVARVYRYGAAVAATDWEGVSEKRRGKIDAATSRIASKIVARNGHVTPSLRTKATFMVMRMMQRNGYNPLDVDYWKSKGWLERERPWK